MVTLRYLARRPFTTQYPEEIRPVPVDARTNLLWFEERCTGCSTCAQACPTAASSSRPRPAKTAHSTSTATRSTSASACTAASASKPAPTRPSRPAAPSTTPPTTSTSSTATNTPSPRWPNSTSHTHDHTYPNGKKAPLPDEIPLHIGKPVERTAPADIVARSTRPRTVILSDDQTCSRRGRTFTKGSGGGVGQSPARAPTLLASTRPP